MTIADSIRLALTNSPGIKAVEGEAAKASWLLKENNSTYLPTLSANHVQNQNYPATANSPSNFRSAFLEAKMTLYSGGLNEGPVAQAVQTALVQRADLKQAYQEEKAAKQCINSAKSGQLPTVSLLLKKDWQNQESSANPWYAQVSILFNLFDGSKTKAKIEQAQRETIQKHEPCSKKRSKLC